LETGPIDWPLFGKQVGLGLVLGFAIGYAAKKALQIALVALGLLVLTLVVLQSYGFISIHWNQIESVYNQSLPPDGLDSVLRGWIDSLAAIIPGAGGFTIGFFWGLKKG